MRNGIYIATDNRSNQKRACDLYVKLTLGLFGVTLVCDHPMTFPLPDEHPYFIDNEATGHVVFPFPEGNLELVWATPERFAESEPYHKTGFDEGFVKALDYTEEELHAWFETWIGGYF